MDAPGPAKLGDAEMRSVHRLLILLMFLSVAELFTPPAPTFAGFDASAPKPVRRTFAQLAFRQESQSLAVPSDARLRNYGVVWDKRLTRSEMPKSDSGWKWLRSRGVKSIVTFRMENDVDYAKYGFVRVLRIPISDNPPADPPSDQQAEQFLRFIQDPNNAPVHMHCEAGRDRTRMRPFSPGIPLMVGQWKKPLRKRGPTVTARIYPRNGWRGSTSGPRNTNLGVID